MKAKRKEVCWWKIENYGVSGESNALYDDTAEESKSAPCLGRMCQNPIHKKGKITCNMLVTIRYRMACLK